MSSPLLGITLIAVIWLAFWAVKDHSRPSQTFWPFAMREVVATKVAGRQGQYAAGQSGAGQSGPSQSGSGQSTPSRRKPVQQVWRRSRS
jgi:hypothetical protein